MTKFNLSQFKRAMKEGVPFEVVEHYIKPECKGNIRKAVKVQSNGMYTKNINEPVNSKWNSFNGGKGGWFEFGKASQYTYENEIITLYSDEEHEHPVLSFKLRTDIKEV